MATEAQLRRRISELQDAIDDLSRSRSDYEREMNRQMRENFKRLQEQCAKEIVRQKRETEAEYTKRIRELQETVQREMRAKYDSLRRDAEEIAAKQERKLAELSACNEELRTILNRMKTQTEMVEIVHKRQAEMLYEQLQEVKKVAESGPHEFFFRGEFDIIDAHGRQIPEEIKQEMYQAAAADASSVAMEFDLLKIKVEQALNEWMIAFRDYACTIKTIQAQLSFLETNTVETSAGTFRMKPEELDFWSCGTYLAFKEKVDASIKAVEEIERIGVIEYLKKQSGRQRKEIFSKVKEAKKWEDELVGITNCILSERVLSDERWTLAKDIDLMLQKLGYQRVSPGSGFRIVDEGTAAKEWYPKQKMFQRNPMDCYDLLETIQGMDVLRITLVPVRENGVAVRNDCIISIDAKTMRDQEVTDSLVKVNEERIHQIYKTLKIVCIQVGAEQIQHRTAEEQHRKKEPSPAELIRTLEKKYK